MDPYKTGKGTAWSRSEFFNVQSSGTERNQRALKGKPFETK